jgi:hypothetical protein
MPLLPKRLAGPAQLSATANSIIYTVPNLSSTGTSGVVKEIVLCNTSGSAVTVTMSLKVLNVAVGTSNNFLSSFSLAANETVTLSTSLVLTNDGTGAASATTSDQILGSASAGTTVTYILNGYEEY